MIVIVMGVSGCGKTTLGTLLAERLRAHFFDGDDFHPPANVAKMSRGIALTDADRWPWLDRLNAILRHAAVRRQRTVLACSALKANYRERLADRVVEPVRIVFLRGDKSLIAARLAERRHRYMPATLLDSQFKTLEPPQEADAITVDIDAPVETLVTQIALALARKP